MARVFEGERTFLSPVFRPVEAVLYRAAGVDERREQHWLTYTVAMLLFNAAGFLLVYALQRFQAVLPLNPAGMPAVAPDLAFNTAVSFTSNTNWQNYGGESTMSYLTQMAALTTQNFVSAATGIALAIALIRAFARASGKTVGNFWVDLTRCTLYVLLPLSIVGGALPRLAGRAAERRTLCRRDHARRRDADDQPGAGCLADRDQAARHQRRRLLERQLVRALREPDAAQQLRRDALHPADLGGADPHLRADGQGRAAGLGALRRHVDRVPCRRADHLLGGRRGQSELRRARARSLQHGRQGGPLRPRQFQPLGGGHHCRVERLREFHARQLHAARRDDPDHPDPARRDHLWRRRLRSLRHAAVRHHRRVRRRAHGRPHAGISRQEDRGEGGQDGDSRHRRPAAVAFSASWRWRR